MTWSSNHLSGAAKKLFADDGVTAGGGYMATGTDIEIIANKGQANGYAGLGSDGKVPSGQLPSSSGSIVAPATVTTGATSGSPFAIPALSGVPVRMALSTPAASYLTSPASPADGQTFSVRDASGNAGTYNITITATGGSTINGAATYVINENGAEPSFRYVQSPNNWELLGPANGVSIIANLLDYVVSGGYAGAPTASQRGIVHVLPHTITLPASLTGSVAKALTAATGSTAFTLAYVRAGTTTAIATITFSASGTTGAFSGVTIPTLAAGDIIILTAPGSPDATLADIGVSILGSKQ